MIIETKQLLSLLDRTVGVLGKPNEEITATLARIELREGVLSIIASDRYALVTDRLEVDGDVAENWSVDLRHSDLHDIWKAVKQLAPKRTHFTLAVEAAAWQTGRWLVVEAVGSAWPFKMEDRQEALPSGLTGILGDSSDIGWPGEDIVAMSPWSIAAIMNGFERAAKRDKLLHKTVQMQTIVKRYGTPHLVFTSHEVPNWRVVLQSARLVS